MILIVADQNKSCNLFVRQFIRIMKLTIAIVLFFTFRLSAKSFAQTITLAERNVSLSKVFKTIEKQTGYLFFYDKGLLKETPAININVANASIDKTLSLCFKGLPLKYTIVNNTIVIQQKTIGKTTVNTLSEFVLPPPVEVHGTVKDAAGNPLPNASVRIKGSNKGVTTNSDGSFLINVPDGNAVLIFSYTGFESKEIRIGDQTSLAVVLNQEVNSLNAVVVTALGISKSSKSISYATQTVTGDEVNKVKDANFMNTLAGKAAGVVITKGSGGPGSSSRIILRGNKSIMGSNSPLYVIDGVPMNNATGSQTGSLYGAFDGGDAISNINPEDIESIQVLEGASAAALYGSQAANGVILITTKKGHKGTAKITLSSSALYEKAIGLPEVQTTYGQSDPTLNDSWGPKISNGSDKHLREFFKTGSSYINSISVSNGNDLGQFYFSFANTSVKGIVPENHLNKNNVDLRGTTQLLNNKLSLDGSVNYINQKVYNRPQAGFNFSPIFPLYSFPTDDDWSKYSGSNFEVWDPVRLMYVQNWPYIRNETLNSQNPYWIQNRDQNDLFRDRTIFSLTGKYKIFDWLSLQARTNYDRVEDSYEQRVSASTDPIEAGPNGGYATSKSSNNQWYSDFLMTINHSLSNDLSVNAVLGVSNTLHDYYNLSLSSTVATSLSYPNYFSVYALNGPFNKSESKTRISNQAAFGSVTFNFKDRLYLDVTGRNEWSSTVSQPFFYPSFGFSYVLVQSNPGTVSFVKLRGSYAEVGNSLPFGISSLAPPYTLDNSGNVNGRSALPFFNGTDTVRLKPERTKSYEVGGDLRFFNNRLTLNLTYYNATTFDQVFQIQAPAGSGAANFWINGGTILNKGVEAVLNYKTSIGNVKWSSTLTFSRNKNEIRELSNLLKADRFVLTSYNSTRLVALFLTRPADGKYGSYGDMFGKVYLKDSKGNFLLDSTSGLPLLSPTADQYIGNANPDFLAGLNNTLSYKNLSLSFLIDGRFGGGVASATERWLDYKGLSKRTAVARDNGGVMVNGKLVDAKAFYYNQTGAGSQGAVSEYYYDATNVRLRELALGYTLNKVGNFVKELNFSLIGRNLFFFYKKAPFDPELSINASNGLQGIEAYNLPSTRSLGFSIRAIF
ncbi:MAG: SusC/RagA family TonB-linked outer membrane protein [Ginsengibacter sp.]